MLSKCNSILSCKEYKAAGVPLPKSMKTVIESGLQWEEIKFSNSGVTIRAKTLPVMRLQFVDM